MTPGSEDALLACLARYFPMTHPSVLLGRGDDCAVLRAPRPLCVSTDLFLEDVHFRRSYFTPQEAGHKALAVNISDLAACGARPLAFTLCLGVPPEVDMPWLEGFFDGMGRLAGQQRMSLVGGDLSRADKIHISVTVWGEVAGSGSFLTRGGGMPGDSLFVIGPLGLARTGLAMLEAEGRAALENWPAACAAHLTPAPQIDAGLTLVRGGASGRPPALMDLSDGLARDLPRLLGGLGAEIILPEGLLHPEVVRYARRQGLSPVRHAFLGGEDYALLGACAPELLPALHAALPDMNTIGIVTDTGVLCCNGEPVPDGTGFDHFAGLV